MCNALVQKYFNRVLQRFVEAMNDVKSGNGILKGFYDEPRTHDAQRQAEP